MGNAQLVAHAQARVALLPSELLDEKMAQMQFVCGNCFQVCPSDRKYDRIYVGAGATDEMLSFILQLLADDGILVGPFDGKLLKVVKVLSRENPARIRLGTLH